MVKKQPGKNYGSGRGGNIREGSLVNRSLVISEWRVVSGEW